MNQSESISPVLVTLTRGGIVEVSHRGYVCVTDNRSEVLLSRGDPDFVTFLRSSAKPFQAAAVVLSGAAERFALTDREIALIAGSHSGEPIHTQLVAELLGRAGLGVDALQCGIHPPLDPETRVTLERSGVDPTPLHHNCSGKHTGMLLTAIHSGQPPMNYLDPTVPIQQRITSVIAESGGVAPDSIVIGIDGCSAPVHGVPMRAIATMFARLVEPYGVSMQLAEALRRVGSAMRAFPEMVAATHGRICTDLMREGIGRLITAKAGAEGVYGVGWWDEKTGRAMGAAVKIEDGAQRGRDPVSLSILQRYGALPQVLPEALRSYGVGPIKNWRGIEVGVVCEHL